MKSYRSSTLIILVLFSFFKINAQIQSITTKSDIVIKGTVLEINSHWNKDKSRIFTDHKVKITDVFKGILSDSIINITTIGGEVDGKVQFLTHGVEIHEAEKGYFFLKKADIKKYNLIDHSIGFISALKIDEFGPKIYLAGKKYTEQTFEEEIIKSTLFPKMSISEYFEHIYIKDTRDPDTCNILSGLRTDKKIAFSFTNAHYSENAQYLEFDISAKINTPGLKFGKGELFVNYTSQFGNNVIANNIITITRGEIISNPNYNLNYFDRDSHCFVIQIQPSIANNSLYTFNESNATLAHIKLKISDFLNSGNIAFSDINLTSQVYYWCQGSYSSFNQVALSLPLTSVNGAPGSTIGITYTFENAKYINGKLQLDLYAATTESALHSDSWLYINYNSSAFGPNLFDNNKVSYSLVGSVLENNNYIVELFDYDDNTLGLFIQGDPATTNFIKLTTIPQKLTQFVFEINQNNCNLKRGIEFDPLSIDPFLSIHAHLTNTNPINGQNYEPVIIEDRENGKLCGGCSEPKINSFAPTSIVAGNNEILTIKGEGFGDWDPLSCRFFFKDCDAGGGNSASWVSVAPIDFRWDNIIHWSDNEIKLIVESIGAGQFFSKPPCSGRFKVENSCNSDESKTDIDIPYALLNYRPSLSHMGQKIGLSNLDDGGICFTFNDEVYPWVQDIFKEALNDWCSETSIAFFINDQTTNNTANNSDNLNTISIESSTNIHAGAAFLITLLRLENCGNDGYYFKDCDIIIDPSIIGSGSFEDKMRLLNVLKHELGHAHMLNHSRLLGVTSSCDQSIMYYSFSASSTCSSSNEISIKANDNIGANKVFPNSAQIGCNPITQSDNCGKLCIKTSLEEVEVHPKIEVFPNPSNNNITISFENNNLFSYKSLIIKIIDIMGREIDNSYNIIGNEIKVSFKVLQGTYFINVTDTNRLNVTKQFIIE